MATDTLRHATDEMIDALSPDAPPRRKLHVSHKPTEFGYDPEEDVEGQDDEEQEQDDGDDDGGDDELPQVTPLNDDNKFREVKVRPQKIDLDPIDQGALDDNERGGFLEDQDAPTPKFRNQEFRKRGMRESANRIGKRGMRSRASVALADEYKDYFEDKMSSWNVKSPSQIPQEDRDNFFEEVDKGWDTGPQDAFSSIISNIRAEAYNKGILMMPYKGKLVIANPEEWTIDHYIDAVQHHLDTVKKEFASEGDTPKLRTSIDSLCRLCDAMRDGTSGGAFKPEDLDTDGDDDDEDDPGVEGDDGEQEEEGDEEEEEEDETQEIDEDDIIQESTGEDDDEDEEEDEDDKKKKK